MEEKYNVLKLENQLCFPLYASSREVIKLYRPFLDELGITYTQYIAMMVFWQEKKLSVKSLGEKLYLDSGTLTPVLKSLEAKGYVTRKRSTRDERMLIVEITEKGEALKDLALPIPESVAARVNMEQEDVIQLYSLLYKLLDTLKKSD